MPDHEVPPEWAAELDRSLRPVLTEAHTARSQCLDTECRLSRCTRWLMAGEDTRHRQLMARNHLRVGYIQYSFCSYQNEDMTDSYIGYPVQAPYGYDQGQQNQGQHMGGPPQY